MTVVYAVALAGVALAAAAPAWRVLRGPSTVDRIVALDVIAVLLVISVAVGAAAAGKPDLLVVPLTLALLTFLASLAAVLLTERRERHR